MSPRRRRLTAAEVVFVLRKNGFDLVSQKGSHQKWRHPATRKQVIVPFHRGKVLPMGTLLAIERGSGIAEEEWE